MLIVPLTATALAWKPLSHSNSQRCGTHGSGASFSTKDASSSILLTVRGTVVAMERKFVR